MSNHFSESRDLSDVRPCVRIAPGKIGKSFWLYPREIGPEVVQGIGVATTYLVLLVNVLVWRRQNYQKLLLTVRYFESF